MTKNHIGTLVVLIGTANPRVSYFDENLIRFDFFCGLGLNNFAVSRAFVYCEFNHICCLIVYI